MTRFAYCSDLHLDFGSIVIDNDVNADCLILAGDIIEFSALKIKSDLSFNYIDEFFKNISDQFKVVVWVPGNHEYYGSSLRYGIEYGRKYLEANGWGNIKIMNNESIELDGIKIHASTLWTDMNKGNPVTIQAVGSGMNDFVHIQTHINELEIVLRPVDVIKEHQASINFLADSIDDDCIVVTHHAPLYQCNTYPSSELTHAYCSDLSEFILDRPQIKHWVYGHVHNRLDIDLDSTKIMSNCRGYKGYEKAADTFELKYFDWTK